MRATCLVLAKTPRLSLFRDLPTLSCAPHEPDWCMGMEAPMGMIVGTVTGTTLSLCSAPGKAPVHVSTVSDGAFGIRLRSSWECIHNAHAAAAT